MEATTKPEASPSPSLPFRTRIALAVLHTVSDASCRSNGTINRRLLSLINLRSSPNPNPINGVKTSDLTVDRSRNLWFRLFVPCVADDEQQQDEKETDRLLPVIVFFHGGGFSFLSPDATSYDLVCRRFARRIPAIVVSVNYRLTPEHRFPCQYEDGFDVLKFLDESDVLPDNADLSRCFLAGDSAGGNLAHHVAVMASESTFRQLKVLGLVAIQPFFGGEERTEAEKRLVDSPIVSVKRTDWLWKVFLPPGEDRDHEAVNVSGPRAADISAVENFPATVVFVAGLDPLQDWQRRYYQWLKDSGKEATLIEYPNMIHAFYVFPEIPQSSQLISQVKDFVHKHSSSSSSSSPCTKPIN